VKSRSCFKDHVPNSDLRIEAWIYWDLGFCGKNPKRERERENWKSELKPSLINFNTSPPGHTSSMSGHAFKESQMRAFYKFHPNTTSSARLDTQKICDFLVVLSASLSRHSCVNGLFCQARPDILHRKSILSIFKVFFSHFLLISYLISLIVVLNV
jgi:hypothetical protein